MINVFISVPMRNRKWSNVLDDIETLTKLAKDELNDDINIISSEVKQKPSKETKSNLTGLWYLGESLKILSKADFLIGVEGGEKYGFNGCEMEVQAAKYYGIKYKLIPIEELCKDLKTK